MNPTSFNTFECHMYVSPRGTMKFSLPAESGPERIARLEPLAHDKLIDPSFRRLLAAFESVTNPRSALSLHTVQV
jgi:hypothetical protein